MKINQIIVKESSVGGSVAGGIASVAKPLGEIQKRNPVTGLQPVDKIMKGKAKKKGPYQNSLVESKMKDLAMDLLNSKDGLTDTEFKKKYGKTKQEMRKELQQKQKKDKVEEAELQEDDLILIPGQGLTRRTGFVKHDPDKAEHEGETLKNSLHTIIRVATHLNKELSTRDNFPEWVSEKIGSIKGMMVSVMDYLISAKEMGQDFNEMNGGVIAGGGVGEGKLNEKFKSKQQAKLMYAVAGDKDIAKKTGVSQKVAKEFIKKSHGQKVGKLPTKVEKK